MNKLKLFALAALALVGFAGAANAADTVLLATDDLVGISVSYTHLTLPTNREV